MFMWFLRLLKRIFTSKIAITLYVAVVVLVVFTFGFNVRCSSRLSDVTTYQDTWTPQEQVIIDELKAWPESRTYLTYPEWWTVYSSQEYAELIKDQKPSKFPYFRSVGQFWSGYCTSYGVAKRNYPFDSGNHLMLAVIGGSTSVEYIIRGLYEGTVGRVTEWVSGFQTQEDQYAAQVAYEYGAFIPNDPWYAFPFGAKLKGLWKETDLFGKDIVRKWERKFILSAEYGVKAVYAGIIRKGSAAVYGAPPALNYVWIENTPATVFDNPKVVKVKELGPKAFIATLPHYQGFTDHAPSLVKSGATFRSVSKNNEIVLSVLVPKEWNYTGEGKVMFEVPILTRKEEKRLVIQTPVSKLSSVISHLEANKLKLEHIYDY